MNETSEVKEIISQLHKASKMHKGQAKRLEKVLKVMKNVDKKNG
tara:strand:+ start:524 stop:655 length:132 start_codon:yes stop_codon:yes gene_type:complete